MPGALGTGAVATGGGAARGGEGAGHGGGSSEEAAAAAFNALVRGAVETSDLKLVDWQNLIYPPKVAPGAGGRGLRGPGRQGPEPSSGGMLQCVNLQI